MTAWKRSVRPPARLRQRKTVVLNLESLEDRLLLHAGFGRPDVSTLMGDVAHVGEDWANAKIALVNAAQAPQANTPAAAAARNQFGKAWSVMVADWNQMRQDFVQVEFAVLERSTIGTSRFSTTSLVRHRLHRG